MPTLPRIQRELPPPAADILDRRDDPAQCYVVLRTPGLPARATAGTIIASARDESKHLVAWWWDDARNGGHQETWFAARDLRDHEPDDAELAAIDAVPAGLAGLLDRSTGAPHPPLKGRPGGG